MAVAENAVVFPARNLSRGFFRASLDVLRGLVGKTETLVTVPEVRIEMGNISSRFESSLTRFTPIPMVGAKRLGLAVIKTPEPAFQPVSFSDLELAKGERVSAEILDKIMAAHPTMHPTPVLVKAKDGSRGIELNTPKKCNLLDAPLFDKQGAFVGILNNQLAPKLSVAKAPELQAWLEQSAQVRLKPVTASKAVEASLVPIIAWAKPTTETSSLVLPQLLNDRGSSDLLDTWCIPCEGKGFFKCPNCLNGVASVKKTIRTGINPLTKQPTFGTVVDKIRCPVCAAKGARDCPHCQKGRIAPGR